MNSIQRKLAELKSIGWTLAALADELKITVNAVEKWKKGDSKPRYSEQVKLLLDKLKKRKRIPKKRRFKNKRYILSQ